MLNNNNEIKRVVILQHPRDGERYISEFYLNTDVVFPVGPAALRFVKAHGLRHVVQQDFITVSQLDAEARVSSIKIRRVIQQLNELSKKHFGLTVGDYYAFQILNVVGQIHYGTVLFEYLGRLIKCRNILVFSTPNSDLFLKFRPNPQSFFAELVCNLAAVLGWSLRVEASIVETAPKATFMTYISKVPVIKDWLRWLRNRLRLPLMYGSSVKKLLLIGGGYEWFGVSKEPDFMSEFLIREMPFLLKNKLAYKRAYSSHLLIVREILDEAVKVKQESSFDLAYLAALICDDMQKFYNYRNDVKHVISGYDAVVSCVLTDPIENFIAHQAVIANKPFFVWQHGEKGQNITTQDTDFTEFCELRFATDYLVYGPAVYDCYKSFLGQNRLNKISEVGSLQKTIEMSANQDIILYSTGKWFYTATPILDVVDPDKRLFEAQNAIISFFERRKEREEFVFRPSNTVGLNETIHVLKFGYIANRENFSDLLKRARIVILDTPATTLIEACSTKVPVFVLGGRSRYTREFKTIIKKRVSWAEDLSALEKKLSAFLDFGVYEADVHNTEYSRRYLGLSNRKQVINNVKACLTASIEKA